MGQAANADEPTPTWLFVHTASSFMENQLKVSLPYEWKISLLRNDLIG
jgi:hypothetical protein